MTKILNSGLNMDPTTLNSIKENPNKAEGLAKAADQFETLFLQMVLKSMRSASDALASEDSLVNSERQRMYRDMHDGQLTMAMANKGSIGISDAMVRQLSPMVEELQLQQTGNNFNVELKSNHNPVASNEHEAGSGSFSQGSFSQPLLSISKPESIK